MTDENNQIVTVQTDKMFRRFELPKEGKNNFERLEVLPGHNLKQKDEERSGGTSGAQFRSNYSEEICSQDKNVTVEINHGRKDNTLIVPEEMGTNVRNNETNISNEEREQDTCDNRSQNVFTAEIWISDHVNTYDTEQANVLAASELVKERNEVLPENGLEQFGKDGSISGIKQYISDYLFRSNCSEEIYTQNENVTVEMNHERIDNTLIVPEDMCIGANLHDKSGETNKSNMEKQQSDFDDSSQDTFSDEIWSNEMVHYSKRSLCSKNANELGETFGYEIACKMKQSFTNETCNSKGGTGELIDSESHSKVCAVSKFKEMNLTIRKNRFESTLDPSTTDRQKATINGR